MQNMANQYRRSSMSKAISFALLVCGILFVVLGIDYLNTIGTEVSRLFTFSSSDNAETMFVGGAVGIAIGLTSLARLLKSE
jgi:drug/metabolite transporter (DMT)-like permease